jgi:hypothetical protein
MKWLMDKLRPKPRQTEEPQDVLSISKRIGPLIDGTVNVIFTDYARDMINEPITYIVPAVWGAAKEGELTPLQKEINARIAPITREIINSLEIKDLDPAQEFALGYIIRGLFIAKLTYMIEAVKNQLSESNGKNDPYTRILNRTDPAGTA